MWTRWMDVSERVNDFNVRPLSLATFEWLRRVACLENGSLLFLLADWKKPFWLNSSFEFLWRNHVVYAKLHEFLLNNPYQVTLSAHCHWQTLFFASLETWIIVLYAKKKLTKEYSCKNFRFWNLTLNNASCFSSFIVCSFAYYPF